ncbi:7TM diverse intracellular signaling domain-containing protein [Ramlibacter sp. Leaf400]|uniref:7TM diverse intracellular signaling domain-containing protein n=1 Tax=Ramlibacter sp. Leaf400 TaxID=1736365 RepID=UPI0009E9B590|nr:7TM diverse intracellular signaling domain-containing protein [Ramlibacter sp. Leaf400]
MDELVYGMRFRRWRGWWALAAFVVALLLAALPGLARAEGTVVTLQGPSAQASLDSAGQYWLDGSGKFEIDAVAGDAPIEWAATRPGNIYPVRAGQALWIRFTLAELDDSERWYLEIPYPAVNRVTLFTRDRLGQWTSRSAGDVLPVADWPLPHRHPLLPLVLTPGQPQQFYLQVQNPQSFSAPLLFTSERQLMLQEQRTALVLGLYFGLAGLSVVLGGAVALVLRDAAFGLYALAVVMLALTQASITGVAGLHLWPRLPWWNDVSVMVLPMVGMAALLCFFTAAVSIAQRSPRVNRAMLALAATNVLAAAALMAADPSWRYRVMVASIVPGMAVGISVLLWAARRGDRHALWLLVGLAPVAVCSMFPMARSAGLIPVSFWTTHAMQIAIAIELPLLLAVLVVRSQDRREHRRRLHGLERTDPATGLINGQVFRDRLAGLVARSQRLKHQGVVLLVDIVNIEQIRRDFDRRSAEEMPLQVAGRLLSVARDIDSVARLSEHRFGMLLEGPLTEEEAAGTGPKVVARCLMPFKGKPLEWVAQVRVAQSIVPSGGDARTLVGRLEAALAAVPAQSRRAVFTVR